MIVDVTAIVGKEAAQWLSGPNLHKVAAAELGIAPEELNLKTVIAALATRMLYKNAEWRAIGEGIAALARLGE